MPSKLTNILIKIMHILDYETKRFEVNILLHPLGKNEKWSEFYSCKYHFSTFSRCFIVISSEKIKVHLVKRFAT